MEMAGSLAQAQTKAHQPVAWLLLAGLLFLRLPFLAGISLFAKPGWLNPVFQIGTYFLTACLLWWERERLADFHIDGLALAIILLFKPIQTLFLSAAPSLNSDPLAFPHWPSLCLWGISLGLAAALWLSRVPRPKLSRTSVRWFGIGLLAGLVLAAVLAYPMSLQITPVSSQRGASGWGLLVGVLPFIVYQLGYAAVTEEPLFRGFLWGYLRQARWKNRRICLFQAGLFMLGHIYYLTAAPISFWLTVPLGALVFGALVWRTRSLSSSLAAHATGNALISMVAYLLAMARA